MVYIFRLFLFVFLVVSSAVADPRYAIANLGGARYKDVMVQGHPAGFGNVQFTEIFGDARESINELLATGKVPFQEYNLKWKDDHNFSRRDFPGIVEEAKKYLPIINRYPNVECFVSGATEHKLNRADATELAELVLAVLPERCIYVNNPWEGQGAFIIPGPRRWNEVHGEKSQPPNVGGDYIVNYDGSDAFDSYVTAFKQRHRNARIFVIWTSQNNGRKNRNDSTPRPQRRAWPIVELLRMEAFLTTDQGIVKLPNKFLVKPKADQHNVPPEDRALKPVFIIPYKAQWIELRKGTQVIARSGAAEPFADGRWRYYFAKYGYQLMRNSNGPLDLYISGPGGRKQGTTNAGFRQGK